MKKIAVLMFLVICVSITGVYAAWIYTGSTVSSIDTQISTSITGTESENAAGSYSIATNDALLTIDQTAADDYSASFDITGSIVVRFTPNPGAPDDIVNNAVHTDASVFISNPDGNLYEDHVIYASTGAKIRLEWVKQADGTFLATLDAEDLESLVTFSKDFVLSNLAKYEAFKNVERLCVINVLFEKAAD